MSDFIRGLIEIGGREGLITYDYRPTDLDPVTCAAIKAARNQNSLTLVLGAGVSRGSGIQDWNGLIARGAAELFATTGLSNAPKALKKLQLSALVEVRFIETCVELRTAFRSILSRVLYERVDFSVKNETLDSLCEVILGVDGRPPIHDIITYNFDNLLELRLMEIARANGLDINVKSIYSHSTYAESSEKDCIRIYHPHGFIPHEANISALADIPIVFSEEDFHQSYLDFHYWGNLIQLDAFSRTTCLMVGLSFSDANMRRLLDFVRFRDRSRECRHAIIARRYSLRKGRSNFMEDFIREKDFNSLRVAPIWIKSFDEISTVVRAI